MTETQAMKRALRLALRGSGKVSPNPRVGCVLLKNDRVIGEGWHQAYGEAHAEAHAIANASEDVAGATLVVNLEPCAHQGQTPPCTDMLIERQIGRVVIGMTDPNPDVEGGGIAKLQAAGIEVVSGVLDDECRWVNRFFSTFVTRKLPYVIAKAAQSVDGCIATTYGQSKWITSEESRKRGHRLRNEVDAIIVGETTVKKDDPELTVRLVKGRTPKRVVLDADLSLPLKVKLFSGPDRNETIVFSSQKAVKSVKANALTLSGITLIGAEQITDGMIDVNEILGKLAERNITSVLVEGGAQVLSSFMKADVVDELQLFVAPMVLGGGLQTFGQLQVPALRQARNFDYSSVGRSGDDIHVVAVRRRDAVQGGPAN